MLVPVILCGGKGTRLWPVSTDEMSKPFVEMHDGSTLFDRTLRSLQAICQSKWPIIVSNRGVLSDIRTSVTNATEKLEPTIILEPCRRGTAPAVALAAMEAISHFGKDAVLLVMPADHLIAEPWKLGKAVSTAYLSALNGRIVTFGVKPTYPAIGYGYIEREVMPDEYGTYSVARFIEKPNQQKAEELFRNRHVRMLDCLWKRCPCLRLCRYFGLQSRTNEDQLSELKVFWNSGIYMMSARTFLSELASFDPELYMSCLWSSARAWRENGCVDVPEEDFEKCIPDSVDKAVAEKSKLMSVQPVDMKWADLGTWDSVFRESEKNEVRNVLIQRRKRPAIATVETHDSLVCNESRPVAVVGLSGVAVIESEDGVLVTALDKCQKVREAVRHLKNCSSP